MLSFPNAKINLGLNIVSRRPDGYHNIESCFYPIPWKDVLEIIPNDQFRFSSSGLEIAGDPDSNLCIKAYHLLRKSHDISPVYIHLHKVIPMGAGLGGGSADGAFTLKMLNDLFELKLTTDELEMLAGKLGSDCPFFIQNKPAFVTDTGNVFENIDINLSGKFIALKHPDIHIGTKDAYSKVSPKQPDLSIREILKLPGKEWKQKIKNDFESSVFPQYPEIGYLKQNLYQEGAFYASMSGSGSAVYGLFDNKPDFNNWKVFEL